MTTQDLDLVRQNLVSRMAYADVMVKHNQRQEQGQQHSEQQQQQQQQQQVAKGAPLQAADLPEGGSCCFFVVRPWQPSVQL